MAELVAFLAVAAVVIATPGQDTALTIRNTLAGGRGAGVLTACGVASGQAVWTMAASAGVAAVLIASEPVFVALKLVGAAYLVALGLQALRDAFAGRSASSAASGGGGRVPARVAYRQGLISNLGNPKMAVFFTSLLPQFAGSSDATFAALLALGLVFCAMTLAWLSAYAVAVTKAGDVLRRSGARRLLDALTGAVLVALGLRLAAQQR